MKNQKSKSKPKGLTDKQLIEKYESGKAPMKKYLKAMLNTSNSMGEKVTNK